MRPLISILIPVHNSAEFLEECIRSSAGQDHGSFEIVAVDDGSTDDSAEILRSHSDVVRCVYQDNGGLASCANTGVAHCRGEFIKWISPDDVMAPGCLSELARHRGANTIVYSDWDIINERSERVRSFSESDYNSLPPFEFGVRLLDGQQVNINTSLIPAGLARRRGIRDLADPVAADYDFFLGACLHEGTRFFLVRKPLVGYRIHGGQLSRRGIARTLSSVRGVRDERLREVGGAARGRYEEALRRYRRGKPPARRALEAGRGILSRLPGRISDPVLAYYLDRVRTTR